MSDSQSPRDGQERDQEPIQTPGWRWLVLGAIRGIGIGGALAVVCLLYGGAAAYFYETAAWLLWAACLGHLGWIVWLSRQLLKQKAPDAEVWRLALAAIAGVILIGFFDDYVLYLLGVWEIDVHPLIRSILTTPQALAGWVSDLSEVLIQFLLELIHALLGPEVGQAPPPLDSQSAIPTPVMEMNLGPVLSWILNSVWQVVIGLLGSILFALVWKPKG